MVEQYRPHQVENMTVFSRSFEKAWNIYWHRQQFPESEIDWALDFLLDHWNNYEVAVKASGYPIDPITMDMVFAGLYHHGITPPPDFQSKATLN